MIFEDDGDGESGWSKWWLLGVVLVGLPLLALGISSMLGKGQEKIKLKPAEKPAETPPPPSPVGHSEPPTPRTEVAGASQSASTPVIEPDVDYWTVVPAARGSEKPLEDRRDVVRLHGAGDVSLSSGEVLQIVDLSPWGMHVKGQLSSRNLRELVHVGPENFPCRIVWTTQDRAGLSWSKPTELNHRRWLAGLLKKSRFEDSHRIQRRQWTRALLGDEVTLEDFSDNSWSGHLVNLSLGGAAVRFPVENAGLAAGEKVRLVVPTGKRRSALALTAVVVEHRNNVVHLRFMTLTAGLRKRLEGFLSNVLSPQD